MPSSNPIYQTLLSIGEQITDAFRDAPDLAAILVTGSTALGSVDERSDLDLLLITYTNLMPVHQRFSRLSPLGQNWQWDLPTNNPVFGERAEKDGLVNGKLVTICYQTVPIISATLDAVLQHGAISTPHIPFRPYTLLALLQRSLILLDRDQLITDWRARLRPYPPQLKQAIIQDFLPTLQEATEELIATAERNLGPLGFLFHLNHGVDALISILYALNEVYDPAERRALTAILPTLPRAPENFVARLTAILEGPFDPSGALQRAHHFSNLAQEVLALS